MDVAGLAFLHDERRILSTYVESSARSWGVGGCGRRIARSIESTPAVRCPASARHLAGSFDEDFRCLSFEGFLFICFDAASRVSAASYDVNVAFSRRN